MCDPPDPELDLTESVALDNDMVWVGRHWLLLITAPFF
jgi:hypothetical protein